MVRRGSTAPLVALLVATCLLGCGSDDDAPRETTSVVGKTVTARVFEEPQRGIPADVGQWMVDIGVAPNGELAYNVAKVIAPAGNANFRLRNPQEVEHDLTVETVGTGSVQTPLVSEGSGWLRISLYPDVRYVFYCSVPGHREAGTEGRIEVDTRLEADDLEPF